MLYQFVKGCLSNQVIESLSHLILILDVNLLLNKMELGRKKIIKQTHKSLNYIFVVLLCEARIIYLKSNLMLHCPH